MPFLIETFDKPDSQALRKQVKDAHLEYLDTRKHLLLAGGDKRSDDGKRSLGDLYLLDVDSRQDAASFIAEDPFIAADLFERVVILRWDHAYLNGRSTLARRLPWRRRAWKKEKARPGALPPSSQAGDPAGDRGPQTP
jgi:uncharacterized protein YciI